FNPLHAVGVLSAIAPDILGAVYFHPGVRPASVPSGAAGVVDLRSRAAGGEGRVRGLLDLSMAGAKLAADQRIEGRGGWVLAARRSHLDLWEDGAGLLGTESIELPYVFHDVAARTDLVLGSRARLVASGLWEEDRLFGDLVGVLERTEARWGNTAGRVTLHTGIAGVDIAHSLRASRFRATTDERFLRTRDHTEEWHEPASDNRIQFVQIAGEASPAGDAIATWSLGWDVAWQSVDYDGPLPRYHAVKPDTAARLRYRRELTVAGAWAETRRTAGRLTINPGLRIETGDDIANAPALRLAPRLALRWAFSADQTMSVAAGRSWQYAQAIALAGPSIHPAFHASHFWVWPDARTPALRSDIASIGTERWLGSWLASATAYVRHSAGVAVPDPVPGNLLRRALHVIGENDARGIEIGIRRIGSDWSTSVGYSYAHSEIAAAGLRYPAPSDRRHLLDAMAALRLPAGFRLSAAYTGMSGAPFTRAVSRSPEDCELFGFGCGNQNALVQEPNAVRTPAYHGVAASLHWSRTFGGFEVGAYVQLRNALDRDNAVTYAGTVPLITRVRGGETEIVWDDRLEAGLPRLPMFGARIAF
ncbi:MAG TPA: TonB-dependent receptor, partial [Longimicrobiales bacterium]|nr:TonB-dependent receptor [Longimicrobiales bacterium]